MPEIKPEIETPAKIKVVGVGGSGCSAVNRMIASKIRGVEFVAINTDVQALHHNEAKNKLHIGQATTKGLGAGMNPDIGLQAAQENINDIRDLLKGSDMVFITCGLGGGTGTGAAPVVAAVAQELGALVVAVVTKPFGWEGTHRRNIAEKGYKELSEHVDTIISISNEKILQIIEKKTSFLDAFKTVDDILRQGVQGISELITIYGNGVNVDFADVKSIMSDAGSALMGIGEMSGDGRATIAAKKAISSPLLDISIDGAKGILFNVTGPSDLTMEEVDEAARIITESADPNARIIFGTVIDDTLKDKIRVTVVATGFGTRENTGQQDQKYSLNKFLTKKVIENKISEAKTMERPAAVDNPFKERSISSFPEAEERVSPAPRPFQPAQHQPMHQNNPYSPVSQNPRPIQEPKEEEEDLEIPAFIRKKMK